MAGSPPGEDRLVLPSWAIPLIVAGLVLPTAACTVIWGPAAGTAAAAATAAALIVVAARLKPSEGIEVAPARPGGPRVLVLAPGEIGSDAAGRIAAQVGGAADVRILVPTPSRPLSRWLSSEDEARETAQRRLAHSAGALTAAGLAVSGSVGDSDPVQALEDELRDYPAERILVFGDDEGAERASERIVSRIELPVVRIG